MNTPRTHQFSIGLPYPTESDWEEFASGLETELIAMAKELNEAKETVRLLHTNMVTAEKRGVLKGIGEARTSFNNFKEISDVMASQLKLVGTTGCGCSNKSAYDFIQKSLIRFEIAKQTSL
jgi:hypothetical protein